jgi:predicted glycoside hydrolase/deacetylase ChbG (UPF0249 family)
MDVPNMSAAATAPTSRMVINADDFGYFHEVTRGIVEAAERGVVTATGVMANGPALENWAGRLSSLPSCNVGVHLNATLGKPLTTPLQEALADTGGQLPKPSRLLTMLLRGQISAAIVLQEWRAQIERCRQLGLQPCFLNSHEHVHMLPQLYAGTRQLAQDFGIAHVRVTRPEWRPGVSVGSMIRNGAFSVFRMLSAQPQVAEPEMIGLNRSGRLDMDYCRWRFARLRPGATYELMCHPGWSDPVAQRDPELKAYHDWEGELRMLLSAEFVELLGSCGISRSRFGE